MVTVEEVIEVIQGAGGGIEFAELVEVYGIREAYRFLKELKKRGFVAFRCMEDDSLWIYEQEEWQKLLAWRGALAATATNINLC